MEYMELGIIGLVTDEGACRVWTRDGSYEVAVDDSSRLRRYLGGGRVDREAMLPGGVATEMVLLDASARTLTVSAPYQPEDGQIFPLGPPFGIRSVREADVGWSETQVRDLPDWLAACIDRAGLRGEVLTLHERNADARGTRRVQCHFEKVGDEWCAVVSTNSPPDDAPWRQGQRADGSTVVRFADAADGALDLALLASMVVVLWSSSPLNLVLGWSPAPDGPRPRWSDTAAVPVAAAVADVAGPKRGKGRKGRLIDAIHIPASLDEPLRVVSVDRRDAAGWYPLVHGGPVEPAHLLWAGLPPHELYVNSRYSELDPSLINERATDLLEQCNVPMALGYLRGDALLVAGPDGGNYPQSVAAEVVRVLCD